MSMNYSPELVQALMRDRILEARQARLARGFGDNRRVAAEESLSSRLARLLSRRQTAQVPVACTSC